MKTISILVVAVLFLFLTPVMAQDARPECTQQAVADWMVQRQVGRNKVQPLLAGGQPAKDAILILQKVRRELEDLPRPACADELYILTIYFYDNLTDALTFTLLNDNTSAQTVTMPRLDKYRDEIVEPLYQELQTIAAIDVMAEANKIVPAPTQAATSVPVAPLEFSGSNALVLGPVEIPIGIYRARVTTERSISVAITATQGECGAGSGSFLIPGLFILSPGEASNGSEAIFTSLGCTALIEVSLVREPWTLTFEKVGEP